MKRREKDQRAGVSRLKAAGGLVNLCARGELLQLGRRISTSSIVDV